MSKNNKNIMRIRFFSSFCDGETCKTNFENFFELKLLDYYGPSPNKKLYITNDDDYTHVIILNTAMPVIKPSVPKKNVIGLSYEPIYFLGITHEFVEYAKKYINKYFIGDKKNLPEPFIEKYSFMWHTVPLKMLPIKNKLMSIMVSQKAFAPGHKYRYDIVNAILNTNLPIDIYGRGCINFFKEDSRLKGEFTDKEPYEDYQFHICIENFQCNEYFSEKIINSLLCSCMPIYLGCYNIKNHFNEENIICLSGDLNSDLQIITNVALKPEKYYKKIEVEKIKDITNLFRNLHELGF